MRQGFDADFALSDSQESIESWETDEINAYENDEFGSQEQNLGKSSTDVSEPIFLGWIPNGVLMSNQTILSIDKLWKSMEDLWIQKTKEIKEGLETIVPVAIITKNGNAIPINGFWKIMDNIWAENYDNVPDYKPVPEMTRDSKGMLIYSDGTPVLLPSPTDLDLPVIGWKKENKKTYIVSLLSSTGEIKQVNVSISDFKKLLSGKSVKIDENNVVGAQFVGEMWGYPGICSCPYIFPSSRMYTGGWNRNYFQMSSGSSSGWISGSYW